MLSSFVSDEADAGVQIRRRLRSPLLERRRRSGGSGTPPPLHLSTAGPISLGPLHCPGCQSQGRRGHLDPRSVAVSRLAGAAMLDYLLACFFPAVTVSQKGTLLVHPSKSGPNLFVGPAPNTRTAVTWGPWALVGNLLLLQTTLRKNAQEREEHLRLSVNKGSKSKCADGLVITTTLHHQLPVKPVETTLEQRICDICSSLCGHLPFGAIFFIV